MTILSYYQLDYQGIDTLAGDREALGLKPYTAMSKTVVPAQFQNDVKALCEYSGLSALTEGMTIKMSLREALKAMPRKRERIDSYSALVGFLQEELAVSLIINSQKTKKHEKELL